jgi:hypothetical protein
MNVHPRFIDGYDRFRDFFYSRYESLFPRPVQVRLIEILGGTTITIGGIRHNNRPMTLTISRGKLLRSRRFRRAVINDHGVLATDVRWAIIIQGADYERDVVSAYQRDEQLEREGWNLAYISLKDIWNNPNRVRQNLLPLFAY